MNKKSVFERLAAPKVVENIERHLDPAKVAAVEAAGAALNLGELGGNCLQSLAMSVSWAVQRSATPDAIVAYVRALAELSASIDYDKLEAELPKVEQELLQKERPPGATSSPAAVREGRPEA